MWRWLLCSAALAATVLFNWIGGFALAVFALCYLLARGRGWLRAAGAGGYAYLLVSPWIPPSTIAVIAFNAQLLGGQFTFTPRHWLYAALFALALAALVWALRPRARAARNPIRRAAGGQLHRYGDPVVLLAHSGDAAALALSTRVRPRHLSAGRGRGRAAVALSCPRACAWCWVPRWPLPACRSLWTCVK